MASKNIKGITIEIGGNTTKLQDALKGVDKQVYSLNSDLKALDKALKLDPTNTNLLAQKQDVLKRSIEATTERLNTLKEAQKQMGDYNKLTDEQKTSYNQLSLEIAKSEKALKDMNSQLKESTSIDTTKLTNGLKKVGEVALDVTKKLLQVTTAISGALTGLVTAGVKSYANLEQNLGGIETLFKESSDKVLENAKNAYKTAGVSANEYMQGVTSFSASLLQSLSNDTSKAADVADMAFRDMSDNANKFGTDMQSIQNAYQGFAKQNYTMLDNLKLGYGGTKTEMERLLQDAEKFSGVHYDISNLSDVYNAIHVIQEELGVTGTTAEEAEKTISGSAASMKAAFDNFLNGSGSPEALADSITNFLTNISKTISQLAPSILKGVTKLIKNLIPQISKLLIQLVPQLLSAVEDMIKTLLNMLTQNTTQISNAVTTFINQIIDFITDNLPMIVEAGIQILLALVNGITESIPKLAEALPELITTIINILIENIPSVLDAAIKLLMALVEAIPVIVEALVDALPTIIETLVETLINDTPTLLDASIKLLMALVEAIPKICLELAKITPTIIVTVVKTLWDNRDKVLESGKKVLLSIKDGIVNNLSELAKKVKEIPGKIKDWVIEGLSKIKEIGTNIVEGIWEGISDGYEWIKGKLKQWVGNVTDFLKKCLGIKSPSKVMADKIGKFMGEGVAVGFEDAMYSAERDMANAIPIDSLVSNVNGAMRGLTRGINTSINPQINPNITYEQNYQLMTKAMKEALNETPVILDDREVGMFVTKTITEEIY